jgi:3-isopropylmalate/(R)-2-methylmalate dehydratase small subunit
MQPFITHTGIVAPLDRPNVDTDQIIPKQFLKRIERTGFGQFLFFDWRFDPAGNLNPEFELNAPRYQDATILLAGRNFGCGSSREHAVWSLADCGFRAIIAPSFADIFFRNALGNGLLPITLPAEQVDELVARTRERPGYRLSIDLEQCLVDDGDRLGLTFVMDPFSRHCLLNGLDDIGLTLQHEDRITAYEQQAVGASV